MSKKQRIRALETRVAELVQQMDRLQAWIETMQAERKPTPYPVAGKTITSGDPPGFVCWDDIDSGTTFELPPDAMITLTSTDGLGRSD